MRRTTLLASLIAGVLALAACAASPAPASTPSAGGTEPVPSETPTVGAPAGIVIGAEATTMSDEKGTVILSLRYAEDGDEAVVATTAVLGAPTGTRHAEGSFHYAASDITIWGGFEIAVNRYTEEAAATGDDRWYKPAFMVRASAATTNSGVSIEAVGGVGVGDDFDAVAAGKPEVQIHVDETFGVRSVVLDLPTSFPAIIDADGEFPVPYGAIGWSEKGASTLTSIYAPITLYSQA